MLHPHAIGLVLIKCKLFKVTNRADAVLVKVYGDGTDITIDRNSTFPFFPRLNLPFFDCHV